MSFSGNLRDQALGDLLHAALQERRSGVLRLRHSGPEGSQRGDLVLVRGRVVGAALSRSGGVTGTGDALVEVALCSPEDAVGATQHAATVGGHVVGALAAGSQLVGVPLERVEAALRAHIVAIAGAMKDWRSGTWEMVLEGLPATGIDRDSAAARAFMLDDGMTPSAALGEAESDLDTVTFLPPVDEASADDNPWESGEGDVESASSAEVESPTETAAAESEVRISPQASAKPETKIEPPPAVKPEPAYAEGWFDDAAPDDAPSGTDSAAEVSFETPPDLPSDTAPEFDLAAEVAAEEGENAAATSAPGPGELAVMEAETLLDGEVLSVMLEMGNSAAATAAEAMNAETGAIRTGHLVLADEDGQLSQLLVIPLRDHGFVVHIAKGRAAAIDRITVASEANQRPLVICDLLMTRKSDGMLGGIDVAEAAAALDAAPPVILLAETNSDDVRAMAKQAKVSALLARPLRSELKKNEAVKTAFLEELLVVIDANRPRPEWQVGDAGTAWDTNEPSLPPHEGWDVAHIERRAINAEDLPEFAPGDPAARRDALWRETMRELSGPLSPQEILLHILRFGAEVLSRGVLFTPAGKGELKGFGQFGVELAPQIDPDEAIRQLRFPPGEHPGVRRALEGRVAVRWTPTGTEWEEHLIRGLGGDTPVEVVLGPIYCQGRLAAVFYGDMLPSAEGVPETTNLEVILGQAGLALDRHLLEARVKALEASEPGRRPRGQE